METGFASVDAVWLVFDLGSLKAARGMIRDSIQEGDTDVSMKHDRKRIYTWYITRSMEVGGMG